MTFTTGDAAPPKQQANKLATKTSAATSAAVVDAPQSVQANEPSPATPQLRGAALSGVLNTVDGKALPNVTIEVAGKRVRSDTQGRFLISGLVAGRAEIWIDGRTANRQGKTYGTFLVGVDLKADGVTAYPQIMWMPEIDTAHAVQIGSPTKKEVVVTNPGLPNFELRIPAGTKIVDHEGKPVTSVSVTPVALGKIPFPMVPGYPFKSYYTIQPDGAKLVNAQYLKAQIFYPNWNKEKPGFRYFFHAYEPDEGWGDVWRGRGRQRRASDHSRGERGDL